MKNQTPHTKKRILLIAPFPAPFINVDIQILRKFGEVKTLIQNGVKAVFSILWNAPFCDILYCWFGSVYSSITALYARMINKPCIIIIGGVDAATIPEINYGIWLTPWKAWLLTQALPHANIILTVAPSLKNRLMQLANYDGKNIDYLPTGYDTDFWTPGERKEKVVLAVAESETETRLKIKGVDYFLLAAEKLPQTAFVLIGVEKRLLDTCGLRLPKNIKLFPAMKQEELRSHYQRSAVFCQPSRSEGMPNTLCEAMACGCIPVGTDVDGISLAIGDTGFVVPLGDIDRMAEALLKAISLHEEQGQKARERIISEFPLERRMNGLRKVIDPLSHGKEI